MAAISAVLHLLRPGDKIIVNELIYGCSYRFISDYCTQFGIQVVFCDLSDPLQVENAVDNCTAMIFFETPTNPFLKSIDIKCIVEKLRSARGGGIVVVDNTWATSLFQRPLLHGADVVLYSNSKFFSGHSDIITGTAVTRNTELATRLESHRFYAGSQPDPFAAWLLRRSLQTLAVRMNRHVETTSKVAQYLREHSRVEKVYLPRVDGVQLTSYGGLLFVRFGFQDLESVASFVDNLSLFDLGTAMASVSSAVARPYFGSHLSMSPEEKARVGLDESLVRLSLGLEDADDLIEDLGRAIAFAVARERLAAAE